ncbi:MAG: ASCH domain-containing protein [Pseudomonadota bacterium]
MITLEEAIQRYPGARTFSFGDSPALVEALNALVRSGKKRATCASQAEIDAGEPAAVLGHRDIALEPDGSPAFVIETLELRATTFAEMTEEMALAEGEDETLAGWQENHRRYYERVLGYCKPDMPLVWERFRVVEDFGS